MPNRFRADLIDVAWANEHTYGTNPPANSESVTAQTFKANQSNVAGELWGQWGLVSGGIDLPNPTYEWQPFFGLGVLDRNMMFPIQGRERLEGRIGSVLMCHDSSRLFMEQCIGLIFNGQNILTAAGTAVKTDGTAFTYAPSTATLTADLNVNATNVSTLTVASGSFGVSSIKPADADKPPVAIVIIASAKSGTTSQANTVPNRYKDTWAFIGGHDGDGDVTKLEVYQDRGLTKSGWNGIFPSWATGVSGQFSVHSITREDYNNSNQMLGVTADISENNGIIVRPTLTQESFMIAARFRADDGSNFVTNYKGCKVSRVVFNFEEGNPVNYGVDFLAQDMRHNIGEDEGAASRATTTLKYAALGNGTDGSVTATVAPAHMKDIRVTEQPHFYSRVELTFQGVAIARFRRFSLTVDNQLDPRYYITQNSAATPADDRQILHEILEGRRNITFSGSLDLDNAGHATYPGAAAPSDVIFLRYLLNQAFTSTDIRDMATLKGIGIRIEVRRASNVSPGGASNTAYAHDKMFIYLPSNASTQTQGNEDEVGMVLRSASMNAPAPPNIHVPMDLDGFCSSMHMEFLDNVADGAQAWG